MKIIIEFSDVTAVFTDQLPTQLKFNIYHIKEELVSLFPPDGKYQYPGLSLGFRIALLAGNHNNLLIFELNKLTRWNQNLYKTSFEVTIPDFPIRKRTKNKLQILQKSNHE